LRRTDQAADNNNDRLRGIGYARRLIELDERGKVKVLEVLANLKGVRGKWGAWQSESEAWLTLGAIPLGRHFLSR
jgi:hypothetical protein